MADSRPPTGVYQLRIDLLDITPPVWRRVLVPQDIELDQLHEVIGASFGWTGAHLHEFDIEDVAYGPLDDDADDELEDESGVVLASLVGAGDRFVYTYDFGDDWRHEIAVEQVSEVEPGLVYPACIDGGRACPPEDSGGPTGYARLLAAGHRGTRKADHPDSRQGVDAEAFDLQSADAAVRQSGPLAQ